MKSVPKRVSAQSSLVERLLGAPVEVPTPAEREAALIAMTLPVVDDAEVASEFRRQAPAPRKTPRRSAA
ncbi:MAG: hypothetical protein IPK82_07275 [Polyangiaceae bacterium]|nr:hypothetical protein [Polyangiaceae bacterium]